MQFQVPQFIETEDKIVGFFSLRQFAYVFVAGILSAILYFTVNLVVWIIFSLILTVIALTFAFLPIQGQSFQRILLAFSRYSWHPQQYLWRSENSHLRKTEALPILAPPGSTLENILLGFFLKKSWHELQTGSIRETKAPKAAKKATLQEQYAIFRRRSGERQAARRIDYR